jgi:hypothetical protein
MIKKKRLGGAALRLSFAPLPQGVTHLTESYHRPVLIAPKILVIRMVPHHLPLKVDGNEK